MDEGISHDLFQSVVSIEPENLAEFDQRLDAVGAFSKLPESKSLAAANKRIRNILKKFEGDVPDKIEPSYFVAPEEKQLYEQLISLDKTIRPLILQSEYTAALKSLAALEETVNHFFDQVMVMDKDKKLRDNRLALLNHLYQLFLLVADISELRNE